MSFRTAFVAFSLVISLATGCATTATTDARCASWEVWDWDLVSCTPLGYAGHSPLPEHLTTDPAPYVYERRLVILNERPVAVVSLPHAGMVDEDVLLGAFYSGLPAQAEEVAKTPAAK